MAKNDNLHKAKDAKNDEFYTRIEDVAEELRHYKKHFAGKVVFCNCDDPTWSAFWRYFHLNFSELGLKKLIATHYDRTEPTYKMEYEGGDDNDVEVGVKTPLEGNGDFRSRECLDLLDECDIVVTNPPFSLFREYVSTLIQHGKKFLIIGNKNAITYKEFFPLLKENKVWIGYSSPSEFDTPNGMTKKINGLTRWFTNLDIQKRHEKLILWQRYYDDDGNPLPDAEEPTAITSGDGIAIIKQGTRYFVMDGARRNTLNDNFGLGFADVKDACLAYAKSCELQKIVDHDSPYSEVEFWLDQNKAFEEYMTQVSHEIEQHKEGPYAKYKSFAAPAVRKMLAEKGLTIMFPEKVLIKVWKMRRVEDAMYQKIEEAKKQNSSNVPLDEAFFDSELVDSVEGSIESAKAKSKPKKESVLPFSKYGTDEKKSYRVVKSDELSKPNQPRYVVVETATDKVLDNANGYGYLSYQAAWKGYSYKSKHHLDGTKKTISKSAKEQAKKKAAFFSTDSEQLSFG